MTIQAGGETWHRSDHVSNTHPEVLDSHIAYVLDNWTLAGDRFNETHQCWQRHYMTIVPDDTEAGHMVRVVTLRPNSLRISWAQAHCYGL